MIAPLVVYSVQHWPLLTFLVLVLGVPLGLCAWSDLKAERENQP